MKFKLYCKTESLNALRTKYKVTKVLFTNYIEINSKQDVTDIQKLLNAQVLVGSTEMSILD